MKLWLVRHAAPQVPAGVCYGSTDLDADPQATDLAAATLAQALPHGVALHCSPLRRCARLAQALCALRADLQSQTDQRLAEMDFGTWEGQRWDDIGQAAMQAWVDDFAHHRPGGGESVAVFMARVGQALADTRATGRDALWVTHAGVIRAVQWLADGQRSLPTASQWPAHAPGFGQWQVLSL